jgi:osmotically-inducible protein OsmY
MARDPQPLTRRIAEALAKRTALADLPIAVQTRNGVATLSGKVPSAYEAMLAYRTVEQTPGVRDVVDQLQFQVPDENHPNPLRQKGRPEDIEAYLAAQIRRHLGDLAHVDRVRVRGDIIEIRGTIQNPADRDRIGAIVRSIPLLRDFRVEPSLAAD